MTSTILVYLIAPFGNGRYLHILQILCCIENTQVKHVSKQNSRVKNVLKNVLRIVLVLLMIVLASIQLHWMLKLPYQTAFIVVSAICLTIYSRNKEENPNIKILKSIIMYTFFLSIVIYGEGAITNEIGKYLTFLVAVFFAVDRILSVWKDVK